MYEYIRIASTEIEFAHNTVYNWYVYVILCDFMLILCNFYVTFACFRKPSGAIAMAVWGIELKTFFVAPGYSDFSLA